MGTSRSSAPSSASIATASAVSVFDTLPMRNLVRGVTGTRFSMSAHPNPSDQTTSPSTPTATERPGMFSAVITESIRWRAASMAGTYRLATGASA